MNKLVVTIVGLSIAAGLYAGEEHTTEKFVLKIGDKVTLRLSSNPSTGYSWQIKNDETEQVSKADSNRASIMKYQSKYMAPINQKRMVGVPGQEEWTFVAQQPGAAVIKLEYMRPWEQDAAIKSKVLEFNVQ